jgi:hypothetical protein
MGHLEMTDRPSLANDAPCRRCVDASIRRCRLNSLTTPEHDVQALRSFPTSFAPVTRSRGPTTLVNGPLDMSATKLAIRKKLIMTSAKQPQRLNI